MAGADLASSLAEVVAVAKPDLILVMGRIASQTLLQSSEPFGKLRGQIHSLHGVKVVVTHDAPYLLRNPLDKGKAWEDLCLAAQVVQGYGLESCPHIIPDRAAFRHAAAEGKTAMEIEPNGKAAEEVRQLYKWACEHVNMQSSKKRRTAA